MPNAVNDDGSKVTWSGVPIFAANMDTTGTFEIAEEFATHKMCVGIHKHYTEEQWAAFMAKKPDAQYFSLSIGSSDADFEMAKKLIKNHPEIAMIMLDVANGYQESFVAAIKRVRQAFPTKVIIAGNVVSNEMTEELILSGADIVKVGIGSGSACTTRVKSGVGCPQLSAVIECADAAHGLGGLVMSDGGCNVPGDVAKAFAAGSDFVMMGGMWAGHDESGGEFVEVEGKKFKEFYGMSSDTAMKKYHGGVAEYRSSEGRTVRVPYRGPVRGTILDVLGGVRSTCTYVGAKSLKELSKRTTFLRVTQQVNNVHAPSSKK